MNANPPALHLPSVCKDDHVAQGHMAFLSRDPRIVVVEWADPSHVIIASHVTKTSLF